jgi:hypothetical protein
MDIFNGLKRANDIKGLGLKRGWFIFLYNCVKEICCVAEKVKNKDDLDIYENYKYYHVLFANNYFFSLFLFFLKKCSFLLFSLIFF